MNRRGLAFLGLVAALLGGCLQRNPIDAAVARRGGACAAVARASTVELRVGYPGTWSARMTVAGADRYGWVYDTTGAPYGYLFDGQVVRSFVGAGLVAEDPSPLAPLRSHARYSAVMFLDALRTAGVEIRTDPASPATLHVGFGDGETSFELLFDAAGLLTRVDGPLEFPGVPVARVTAELSDYRLVQGRWLPHRIRYNAAGRELADERVGTYCVQDQPVPAAAFRDVATLPSCP
jgi:hypothetical protein